MIEMGKDKFELLGHVVGLEEESVRPGLSYWENAKRQFLKNKVAMVAFLLLMFIILMAIFGPSFTHYNFNLSDPHIKNIKPNAAHWFGTDGEGRDLFVRVWVGGRTSLTIGVTVAFINLTIGIIYGGICGYYGGMVDEMVMRIIEILGSIPNLIIIILITLVLGTGLNSMIIAMSIVGWCGVARLVRGQLIQLMSQEYVMAAMALGASSSRIISKHLLTNVLGVAIVTITLEIPTVILNEALLGYMGFGLNSISWGVLVRQAQAMFIFYPLQLLIPGLCISLTMLCFNLLGDALSDALDPKYSD